MLEVREKNSKIGVFFLAVSRPLCRFPCPGPAGSRGHGCLIIVHADDATALHSRPPYLKRPGVVILPGLAKIPSNFSFENLTSSFLLSCTCQ